MSSPFILRPPTTRAGPPGFPPDVAPGQVITAAHINAIRDSAGVWPGNVDGNGKTLSNVVLAAGVVASAQTPWLQNINGGGFSLLNAGGLQAIGPAGAALTTELRSPAGFGSHVQLGPAASPASVSCDAAGNITLSHFGVASPFLSYRAGSVANTLTLISGRVLIGTGTDDGVNRVQVAGIVQATQLLVRVAATGPGLEVYDTAVPSSGLGLLSYNRTAGAFTNLTLYGLDVVVSPGGTERARFKANGALVSSILFTPLDSDLPNGSAQWYLATNTALAVRVRGTDGVVRQATLTLA